MLPALPTGMQSASSGRSGPSSSSELERRGLLALEPERVDAVDQRDRVALGQLAHELSASSKLPRSATTRAPCISAWASLPAAILPSGTITAPPMPGARRVGGQRRGGVARRGADDRLGARAHGVADTAQVIPRSLNEPVGFVPSSFSHTSTPACSLMRGASTSGVEPSSQRDHGVVGGERQPVAVALDEAGHEAYRNSSSMTRIARGRARMKSSAADQLERRRRTSTRAAGG